MGNETQAYVKQNTIGILYVELKLKKYLTMQRQNIAYF